MADYITPEQQARRRHYFENQRAEALYEKYKKAWSEHDYFTATKLGFILKNAYGWDYDREEYEMEGGYNIGEPMDWEK